MSNNNKINLQCYPCAMEKASRIKKTSESLIKLGIVKEDYIWATGGKNTTYELSKNSFVIESGLPHDYRAQMRASKWKFIKMIYLLSAYYFGIIKISIQLKPDFITCRRVDLLPFCAIAKLILGKKTKLIYSPHELETEKTGLGRFVKLIFKIIEKIFIRVATSTIVVCQPIEDWYRKTYRIDNVFTIRNIPTKNPGELAQSTVLKDKFNISPNHLLFIYQGVLAEARGTDFLIDIFSNIEDKTKHIVFMGFGAMETQAQKAADSCPNIHFQPAVNQEDIIKYTSSADIGILYLLKDFSLSYRYSLPNKFNEYMHGGIPLLTSDTLAYLSQIVKEQKCGWSVASNVDAFKDFLNQLTIEEVNEYKMNTQQFAKTLAWENEELIFKKAY